MIIKKQRDDKIYYYFDSFFLYFIYILDKFKLYINLRDQVETTYEKKIRMKLIHSFIIIFLLSFNIKII